ncbi:IS3 family transposase [Octadecabacter arcticus]
MFCIGYGSRQMGRYMKRNNHKCGRHRVRRLMRLMRLVPIYQEPMIAAD